MMYRPWFMDNILDVNMHTDKSAMPYSDNFYKLNSTKTPLTSSVTKMSPRAEAFTISALLGLHSTEEQICEEPITKHPSAVVVARTKRSRIQFSPSQLDRLEQEFQENQYLDRDQREVLGVELNLSEKTVKIWFQNRRTKFRKDKVLNQ